MGKRRIKEWLMTTGVILAALLVLIFMFTKFRNRMNAELNTTTAKYLSGNVDALATAFQTKLDDQLIMLESQTRYFRDVDLTDYNAMKETIMAHANELLDTMLDFKELMFYYTSAIREIPWTM